MEVMRRGHLLWKIVALGSWLFKATEVFLPGHRSFAGPQDDTVGGGHCRQIVFVKCLIGEHDVLTI